MSAPTPTPPSPPAPAPAPRPRFYRRRRFWAWSGLGALAGVLGVLFLLYWLLQTIAGRDVLLAQIIARLPPGATLRWESVEGPLAGPLTIHGLDFRYDDYRFTARRAYLDPDIRPLLGRRLRLDAFELEGATLDLAPSDEPFELPRWPESLPAIEMPLAIQADTLVIDGLDVSSGGEHVIDIRRLRGGIDIASGLLHAGHLQVDSDLGVFAIHGDYAPSDNYRSDLLATAVFPAPRGQAAARIGLRMSGDLDDMQLAVGGRAPEPLRATLRLRGGRQEPTWVFDAHSDGLDPGLFTGQAASDAPAIAFKLDASGRGGDMDLSGLVHRGEQAVTIAPSRLSLDRQLLTVAPLRLEGFEGSAVLRGTADFRSEGKEHFRFSLVADGLRFESAEPDTPAIGVDAALGLAGSPRLWATYGEATLTRGEDRALLALDVRGDARRARIEALRATMPTGVLDVTGEAGWDPQVDWNVAAVLDGFDPGYFAPGWDGDVNGRLSSTGQLRADGGIDADVAIDDLGGRLRERPLDGDGQLRLRGSEGSGKLALVLGGSRVQAEGTVDATRMDVRAALQPLDLADLLPTAGGHLQGTVRLHGARATPDLAAELDGNGLQWDGYTIGRLGIHGALPWRGSGGELRVEGDTLQAGLAIESLRVHARGAVQDLALEASVDSPGTVALALSGQLRGQGERWQGSLDTLRVAPVLGDTWALQAPAAFSVTGPRWQLQPACLGAGSGEGAATLCAQADWPRQGVQLHSDRLPLSLLHDWLPRNEGRSLLLRGALTLDGQIRPQGNRWAGELHLASAEGGLRVGDRSRRELLRYDNFSFDVTLDPTRIQGRLGTGFAGDGYVDARFDTGWEDHSPLTGELYTYMSQLFWLELFSPDLVRPRGVVRGHVSLRGTRGQPALGGQLLLEDFQGELPALGLTLSEGKGSLDAQPDGSAAINVAVKSGEGTLTVDGGLSWYGQATPLQLNIRGSNVLVADTPSLRAVASPDLQFSVVDGTMLLRGQVEVPSADVQIERLDSGVSVSEDVVVVDPVNPEETPSAPLDMDLALVLGEDVHLAGYGLDGTLTGRLQVRARPGREMTGTGALEVGGRYEAYNQKLTITRGQMTWSNNLISDPRINLRAERTVSEVTAGIDVTGHASEPRLQVWSNPSMSQSEALSYLMLGRSLQGVSSNQAQQVSNASAAMSAGTGLLASRLGAKLGFDDAGVTQSRSLGGSVVGVGKYITPKLYVGYGVSLVGSGSVVILKYLMRKGFDVELESSTVETRGSVNWRQER